MANKNGLNIATKFEDNFVGAKEDIRVECVNRTREKNEEERIRE
jgi:hypothetical protein